MKTLGNGGIADGAMDLLTAGTLAPNVSFLVVPTGFASDGAVILESYFVYLTRLFFKSDWFNVRIGKHEVDLPASAHRSINLTNGYLVYGYHSGRCQRPRAVRPGRQPARHRDHRPRPRLVHALQRFGVHRERLAGQRQCAGLAVVLRARAEVLAAQRRADFRIRGRRVRHAGQLPDHLPDQSGTDPIAGTGGTSSPPRVTVESYRAGLGPPWRRSICTRSSRAARMRRSCIRPAGSRPQIRTARGTAGSSRRSGCRRRTCSTGACSRATT